MSSAEKICTLSQTYHDRTREQIEEFVQALSTLGSMRFVFSHYIKALVFSEAARGAWVDPDLMPLAFGEAIH